MTDTGIDAQQGETRQTDMMDPARAEALLATLGRPAPVHMGDALPPFFHQIYFWQSLPPASLGRDGHPAKGDGLIPDLGLPRRMWAGGRLEFHAPLRAGIAAEKRTRVANVTRKEGRSGPLGFVTLQHDIMQDGHLTTREYQDLVYRNDPEPDAPTPTPPQAPQDETLSETATFDSTMLFRYSALTFNGHRIHYDEAYARDVEGYDGLVTHGPLLAQLLMLLADRQLGGLGRFSFRASSPLMHHETAELCWRKDGTLWIRAADGRQIMSAMADRAIP
jgi:3-methylfumaryl-CoA hydratase